jgi:hypothetical protein
MALCADTLDLLEAALLEEGPQEQIKIICRKERMVFWRVFAGNKLICCLVFHSAIPVPAAGRQAASGDGTADERMSCGVFMGSLRKRENGGAKGGARKEYTDEAYIRTLNEMSRLGWIQVALPSIAAQNKHDFTQGG